jgi:hypothetical protein
LRRLLHKLVPFIFVNVLGSFGWFGLSRLFVGWVLRIGTITLKMNFRWFIPLLLPPLLLTAELEEITVEGFDLACRGGKDVDGLVELNQCMFTIFMASIPRTALVISLDRLVLCWLSEFK